MRYGVGGSASAGIDYSGLSGAGTIRFAAGAEQASLELTPIADGEGDGEGDETVILHLIAGPGYRISNPDGVAGRLLANEGSALFAVQGTAAVGNTLAATLEAADPDGNGAFAYAWQASADGQSWRELGTEASTTVTAAEQGQQLRLQVSYTDGQGFGETLHLSAGSVPPPPPEPGVVIGLNSVVITEELGPERTVEASLTQSGGEQSLWAIGVDNSRLDNGGSEGSTDTTLTIRAAVLSHGARATAIGVNASTLQLRPGDDMLTIEATITGPGAGANASIAVHDSLISGNRGDDTITLRGTYWGDRALVFGGAGNDTITGYGIGRDSFIQAGDGDDVVSLGRLETTPDAAPLQRAKGDPITPSTYRGGAGFDVLVLRDTSQAEFEAQATPFTTTNESGWLFQGARFSGFEQILFG